VRWFVDGSEIEQARGNYSYAARRRRPAHVVTIEDCTGGIRAYRARTTGPAARQRCPRAGHHGVKR
jgi:hypothetical protein